MSGWERARHERERGVTRVQVRDVCDLVGHERTPATRVVGPAEHAGLEEGSIHDQLTPALEQVHQALGARGPDEFVLPVHREPRHSPALGGHRVPCPRQLLLLDE